MISGQAMNFDRLPRLFWEYQLRIYANFIWMPRKEKDLDVTILQTHRRYSFTNRYKKHTNECCKSSSGLSKKSFIHFNMPQNFLNGSLLIICQWILKLLLLILFIYQQFSHKNQTITPISIETENHTKFYDQLLSISDICWLISIDIYGGRSILIDNGNHQHITSCLNYRNQDSSHTVQFWLSKPPRE